MDRPTRIVAIPGERLPRCCEYGAYPARSARRPTSVGAGSGTDTFHRGRALAATPRRRRSAPRRCATRQRPSSQRVSPRPGFPSGQLRHAGSSGRATANRRSCLDRGAPPAPSAVPEADGTSVPIRRRHRSPGRATRADEVSARAHGRDPSPGQPGGGTRARTPRWSGWGHTRRGHTAPTPTTTVSRRRLRPARGARPRGAAVPTTRAPRLTGRDARQSNGIVPGAVLKPWPSRGGSHA